MSGIIVVGGSGFLGSAIVAQALRSNLPCRSLSSIRVDAVVRDDVWRAAHAWRTGNPKAFACLCEELAGSDVVVNAAGLAAPGSGDHPALHAANAVQPAVLALAAAEADVGRMLQMSTAAVQGRRDPLDEALSWAPVTPYAESKAAAEQALLRPGRARVPREVIVYRPTSVHGPGRSMTRRFMRWTAKAPAFPVAGRGDQPVPVALLQNVAAGVVFAATSGRVGEVVVQPFEGITARRLLELFGARRIIPLPLPLVSDSLAAIARLNRGSASFSASLRRIELLICGQGVEAHLLGAAGFCLPAGHEGWEQLVALERARMVHV